jgi:predicted nucleic-acid-binding protein
MMGLDTNVLVRYFTQDDPTQSAQATRLIESLSSESPGFISVLAMVELVWVLTGCYQTSDDKIGDVLETVLRAKELVVERSDIVWQALNTFRKSTKAGFADCLIERSGHAAGCAYTVTFDRSAATTAGMRQIEGAAPKS